MVPFKSAKTSNYDQDFLSNLPDIAIDKIVKRLPIKMLAKMSVLSTKWRDIWLSLKYLVFDKDFWGDQNYDDNTIETETNTYNWIISNILFHHVGPVHEFYLKVPSEYNLKVHGWISLLSKFGVKKLYLNHYCVIMPPSIFRCRDLVKLKLEGVDLNHVPSRFKGFAYLQSLKLVGVQFKDDVFRSLITKCPQLKRLAVSNFDYWTSENTCLVIDAPSLEHLTIRGHFGIIVFKNIRRLSFVSLNLYFMNVVAKAKRVDHSIEMLASSCQLQNLHCGGQACKYFGAGSIAMSPTLRFLHRLRLTEVNLSDFDEFCFTLGMLQCSPFIKDLDISVNPKNECDDEHGFDYNKNCELKHLVNVKITNLSGSTPEIKLIEYLLSVATNLEKLAFMCFYLDLKSELNVTRNLIELPRSSPKAKLVCLQK